MMADEQIQPTKGSVTVYLIDDMIDSGLLPGQSWPSPAHRRAAINAIIANPLIDSMDKLQQTVRAICAVPADRIRMMTVWELKYEFGAQALWDGGE
jgi:hypothetical protein